MSTLGRAPQTFRIEADTNVSEDFELWLEDLEAYFSLQTVSEAAKKKQLLVNLAGLEVRKIVHGLDVPTPSGSDHEYTVLRDALKSYFRPTLNLTVERHKFRQRTQQPSETLTAYAAALRSAAELCNFSDASIDTVVNCQNRDQFIAGLTSPEICRELLTVPDLTLDRAIKKAVSMELSYTEAQLYDSKKMSSLPSLPVHRVTSNSKSEFSVCKYCGNRHQMGVKFCPAAGKTCSKCQKVGHFTKVCQSRQSSRSQAGSS